MTSRNRTLDVLRGVAVLLVLVCHYGLNPQFSANQGSQRLPLLEIGSVGVDLFFVLSGFLISGLLFSEFKATGSIDVRRFWIRRGFKIYPSFYVFLGATAILALLRTHGLPHELLQETFFVQNYFYPFWVHTWSLAVEEHFYFSLPLLLLVLIRCKQGSVNPFRLIPAFSICLSALCLFLRIQAYRHGGAIHDIIHPTHLRMDALFAGVALGYYAHFDQDTFHEGGRKWVIYVGLISTTTLLILPSLPRLTFAYVVFCFIVAWSANRLESKGALSRGLAWVGYYSYSIYLWHVMAMSLSQRIPDRWFRFPLYISGAVILGVSMATLIELPLLKLRDRLAPSRLQTCGGSFASSAGASMVVRAGSESAA